jgi:hypothetical protein
LKEKLKDSTRSESSISASDSAMLTLNNFDLNDGGGYSTACHQLDFLAMPRTSHAGPIGAFPPETQENYVIVDIVCAFAGQDGIYIVPQPVNSISETREFFIDPSMDLLLKNQVASFVPVFQDLSLIQRFLEVNTGFSDKGRVRHSFAASLRQSLRCFRVSLGFVDPCHPPRFLDPIFVLISEICLWSVRCLPVWQIDRYRSQRYLPGSDLPNGFTG